MHCYTFLHFVRTQNQKCREASSLLPPRDTGTTQPRVPPVTGQAIASRMREGLNTNNHQPQNLLAAIRDGAPPGRGCRFILRYPWGRCRSGLQRSRRSRMSRFPIPQVPRVPIPQDPQVPHVPFSDPAGPCPRSRRSRSRRSRRSRMSRSRMSPSPLPQVPLPPVPSRPPGLSGGQLPPGGARAGRERPGEPCAEGTASMDLKNRCSSGGGLVGDAMPGLRGRAALPALPSGPGPGPGPGPASVFRAWLQTFPAVCAGAPSWAVSAGREAPGTQRLPAATAGASRGGEAGGAGGEGGGQGGGGGASPCRGSRDLQGSGFSRSLFPLPTRPSPCLPPPLLPSRLPSLPSRIKVGTVALRGWVRANASAAGSLCSLPRSPGARTPARPPRRDAAPAAAGAAPLLLALPAAALCPPPALGVPPAPPKSTFCPPEETWWPGLVIIIAVCCATLVFLFVVVIICYKAIKRKPMRKEENGTSRSEYAMTSSQNNKTVDNNAVV
uniref:Proline rich membrane anchor 1 n=1 Tax=Catharus ustulatus TaxID=91951 RepID=A0A8C3UYC6_CATUS